MKKGKKYDEAFRQEAVRLSREEGRTQASVERDLGLWPDAESFFHVLKSELGESFFSKDHAFQELFQYIEIDYNRKRTHSTLGYFSPAYFENMKKYA